MMPFESDFREREGGRERERERGEGGWKRERGERERGERERGERVKR